MNLTISKKAAEYVPLKRELKDTWKAIKNLHKEVHIRAPVGAASGATLGYMLTDPNKGHEEHMHNMAIGTGAGTALATGLPIMKTSPMLGVPVSLAGSIGGGLFARKIYRLLAEKRGMSPEEMAKMEQDDPNILRWIRF